MIHAFLEIYSCNTHGGVCVTIFTSFCFKRDMLIGISVMLALHKVREHMLQSQYWFVQCFIRQDDKLVLSA